MVTFCDERGEDTLEECFKNFHKEVSLLVDPRVEVRRGALVRLQKLLAIPSELNARAENDKDPIHHQVHSQEHLKRVAREVVAKPLLRRFADPSQKCRELATSITLSLLSRVREALLPLLPYFIAALSERLCVAEAKSVTPSTPRSTQAGQSTSGLVEPGEEVRVQLLQILRMLISQAGRALAPFSSDIAGMLLAALTDSNPDTLMEACWGLRDFARVTGQRMKQVARQMAGEVMPALRSRRHRVRSAALQAIREIAKCGASEVIMDLSAFRDPNLIPIRAFYHPDVQTQYLALLATDSNFSIRREFLETIGDWLTTLPDRLEHENRLIPYVLGAFTDSHPQLQSEAFELMERLGLQYEKEKEKELEETWTYLPEDIREHARPLPPPFKRRPCLGSRILVRGCLARLLPAVAAELQSWTEAPRGRTAGLLHTMLLFAEDNATQHLQPLLLSLIRSAADPLISEKIRECGVVLGAFVAPSAYLPLILPRIEGEMNDTPASMRASAMAVLASLLEGTPRERLAASVGDICATLTAPDVKESLSRGLKEQMVEVASHVVRAWGEVCSSEALPLTWALLQAIATPGLPAETVDKAETVLASLASAERHVSTDALLAAHAESALELLCPPVMWRARSLEPGIFCRLMRSVGLFSDSAKAQSQSLLDAVLKEDTNEAVRSRVLRELGESGRGSSGNLKGPTTMCQLAASKPTVSSNSGSCVTKSSLTQEEEEGASVADSARETRVSTCGSKRGEN